MKLFIHFLVKYLKNTKATFSRTNKKRDEENENEKVINFNELKDLKYDGQRFN